MAGRLAFLKVYPKQSEIKKISFSRKALRMGLNCSRASDPDIALDIA